MTFAIQIRSDRNEWTADPCYLGCQSDANRWDTEAEALAACDDLAAAFGCMRSDLRVVALDD